MGVVVVDKGLKVQLINEGFNTIWKTNAEDFKVGDPFRKLIDINRNNGIYDVEDENWEEYITTRLAEIKKGNIEPHELIRVDGTHLLYSVTNLTYGRRLISYFDITKQKQHEIELQKAQQSTQDSKTQLTEAIEALEDGFVIYDNKDKLLAYNAAFKKTFGEAGKHLKIGRSYREMTMKLLKSGIVPIEQGKEEEFLEKLIEERNSNDGLEKIFQTHDGKWVRQRDVRSEAGYLVGTRTDITELKLREEELEDLSRVMQKTADAMVQGMAVFEEGRLTLFNPALFKLLKIKENQIEIGTTFREFLNVIKDIGHYGEGKKAEEAISENLKSLKGGKHHSVERQGVNGETFQVDVIPQGGHDIILTYTDITESKEASKLIEERKELMDSILEASDNALIVTKGFGELVTFNNKALEIFGFSKEMLESLNSFEKIIEHHFENKTYKGADDVADDRQAYINFAKNISKAARETPQILKLTNGLVLRYKTSELNNGLYVHSYIDITEESKREQEIETARQKAETASRLQESISNAMAQGLIAFQDEILIYFNSQAHEILELPDKFLEIGQTVEKFLTDICEQGYIGRNAEGDMLLANALKRARSKEHFQAEHLTKSGNTLLVNGGLDTSGQLIFTLSDVTEMKKREKQLEIAKQEAEQAERAKSEFLANMSHEIRTPMNGVMGMAELLDATELNSKQSMYTDVIINSGASLLTIINDILDFSKIDAGQLELDPAPFDFAEAVEDVATLMSAKCAEKELELIVRFDPQLPKMMVGDVGRIRQVITNLVGNAVKFTEKGHVYINIEGSTSVSGEDENAKIKLSVQDTGIGISPEGCEQVFNKFSQVDSSATRKHEGTGLGLSIASSLINLMGGEIKVDSVVDSGSTFWFEIELPVHESLSAEKNIPGDLTGARILVIDDNQVNRSILSEQMAAWNFDGATSSSGPEGIQLISALQSMNIDLDLIILDYQMPEMDGGEVLEKLKSNPDTGHIPTIMLTSIDNSQTQLKLSKLGAEAHLTKPARSSFLLETILQVITDNRSARNKIKRAYQASTAVETAPVEPVQVIESIASMPPEPVVETSAQEKQEAAVTEEKRAFAAGDVDILLAEDNEVNQIVFTQILEETGYSFKIVENGRLAVATYKTHNPTLILMDVSMPEMNGKDATVNIRAFEAENGLTRTPIIGVTAHALNGDMESCLEAGMDDYLSKPVSPVKLSEKIEEWMTKQKRHVG